MKSIFVCLIVVTLIVVSQSEGIPGGFHDANDPETYEEIRKLTSNGLCDRGKCFHLVKINDVKRQIVAGVLYLVNGIYRDIKSGKYFILTVRIYHVVWENKTECKEILH